MSLDRATDQTFFEFDFRYQHDPGEGQRWSTWNSVVKGAHGPEPRPSWVITSDAAVDTELGILKTGRPPRACIPRFGAYPEMFERLLGEGYDYSVFAADEGELPESPTACDAYLITGVVLVEAVFNYNGLGRFMVDAVSKRDLPLVQAAALVFGTAYVILNIIADVTAIALNPRLRHAR